MRWRTVLAPIIILLLLCASLIPASFPPATAQAVSEPAYRKDKVHPELRKQLDQTGPEAQFTVIIKGADKPRLEAVKYRSEESVAALKAAANRSQGPVISYLRGRGAQVLRQFWLVNAVVARVDKPTLQGLTRMAQVEVLFDNFQLAAPPVQRSAAPAPGDSQTWGLAKLEAQRVWNELGVTGEGIRVAVLDTGIDMTHPDLNGKLHTDNPGDPTYPGGWLEWDGDGNPVASEPRDSAGHGTHVSGTVAGGSASGMAIGVAPGVTLMHGLVLPGGGGTFAQVIAGMQWAVEPTDATGAPAGQRAHIASMSFGADGLRSEVIEPIRNMLAAGVLPIAAMGNCGARCVGSPGAVYDSFGIGASAEDDSITDFSSGDLILKSGWANPPDEWPDEWVKPDISAPGINVISAVPGGGYESWAGTSMATPHVSGAAALMLAANPSLTPADVLATLEESSYWDNRYSESRPDIRFGWGRINAYEATVRIAYNSGITGTITGADTGAGLGQAVVSVVGTNRSARTAAAGSFKLVLPPGTYDLAVERFGYEPAAISGVVVTDGNRTPVAAALTPLPKGRIRGRVTYARTGLGLPGAAVTVEGIPVKLHDIAEANGSYELELPVGTYRLSYTAHSMTKAAADGVTVDADATTWLSDTAMSAMPKVAVIGDVDNILSRFLQAAGYDAEPAWFDVQYRLHEYDAAIVNLPFKAMPEELIGLVKAADQTGTGLLFTKGYWFGWGIDMLKETFGDPVGVGFDWFPDALAGKVTAPHPDILPGWTEGERFDLLPCCQEVAWFDGYSGTTLLELHNSIRSPLGSGVAVKQNANNRHVLLASFGVQFYQGPNNWSEDARQVFLNSLRWAARPEQTGARFVTWDLQVSPGTVLWSEPVTVTARIKNIGDATAWRPVSLSVNGEEAGFTELELAPDQTQSLTFTVQREPVGSYRVQLDHLSAAFRVRPPTVSVSARTVSLPPSGRGPNAEPGEPAIPLAGATVELVRKGKVISRGTLDGSGTLTFDSTASRDDYTLVVRHHSYGYNKPRHYLLSMPVHVEADSSFTFAPQAADVAQLDVALTARNVNHHGSVFVNGPGMETAAFEFDTGTLVVTPGSYKLAYVMAYDVPGAQWAYASQSESRNLAAGTHAFTFGGNLTLRMSSVRGQQAPKPQVAWGMADAYGHELAAIYKVTSGAFGPTHHRVVGNLAAWPATVAATAKEEQKPVLTLTNPLGAIDQTGTIGWAERPRSLTMPLESVLTGDYGLLLQAETGPYAGLLQATSKLMLPARSVSRSLVMPGDTFDVTVVFDAGSSGAMSLSESLPAGFSTVKQQSLPAGQFSGNTWTWQPSGKNSYRAGQVMKVTYTVKVGPDVAAGTYSLAGKVSQGTGSRQVAGPQAIHVVR